MIKFADLKEHQATVVCTRCKETTRSPYLSIPPKHWSFIEIVGKEKKHIWMLCPSCLELLQPALDILAAAIFGGKNET